MSSKAVSIELSTSQKYETPSIRQSITSQPYYPYSEPVAPAENLPFNPLKMKPCRKHIQSFIATLLLVAGIALSLVFFLNGSLSIGTFIGILLGIYTLYLLVGCCCNSLVSSLSDIEEGQRLETYYDWIRKREGRFMFSAVCYHYETRHHTRKVRDSYGYSRTEHFTTTEKVITHESVEHLTPTITKDLSGPIEHVKPSVNIIFAHFKVTHQFQSPSSSNNFASIYSNFKARNTRDSHQDFNFQYSIPGLKEKQTFYAGERGCQFRRWLFLCGGMGCLWPFSLWVEVKASRFEVDMIKSLTIQ